MIFKENVIIKGIYEKDLERLLNELGMLEKLNTGEISCIFCGKKINKDNFGGIIRLKGNLELFCDQIECYIKMLEEKRRNARRY